MLLFFGVVEYGWYMTARVVLAHAVAESSRAGIAAREWQGEDPEGFARAALQRSFWPFGVPEETVAVEVLDATEEMPRTLRVAVMRLPYLPLVGYLPSAWVPEHLSAEAVAAFP